MKLSYNSFARTTIAMALIVGSMAISSSVFASSTIPVSTESGKYTTVASATAVMESDGLHIEGALQSRHFTPRHSIKGLIKVTIHDSDGQTIQEEQIQTSSLFVPKGIRQASFSSVIEGSIPEGGTVTVTSLN